MARTWAPARIDRFFFFDEVDLRFQDSERFVEVVFHRFCTTGSRLAIAASPRVSFAGFIDLILHFSSETFFRQRLLRELQSNHFQCIFLGRQLLLVHA